MELEGYDSGGATPLVDVGDIRREAVDGRRRRRRLAPPLGYDSKRKNKAVRCGAYRNRSEAFWRRRCAVAVINMPASVAASARGGGWSPRISAEPRPRTGSENAPGGGGGGYCVWPRRRRSAGHRRGFYRYPIGTYLPPSLKVETEICQSLPIAFVKNGFWCR
ncbi:hypothetical protein EVAR_6646_1 [Eumeta japonica]|uniref:Uncharacterized protein n=1 Tax=Eumeta variegata TaxID=151549 RepID=A0A4C1TK98_EUMVA|nr:hypothetical protein EVAR_6646_1 [Eumeta japonica]